MKARKPFLAKKASKFESFSNSAVLVKYIQNWTQILTQSQATQLERKISANAVDALVDF